MSWTDKLKGVDLHPIYSVVRHDLSSQRLVGDFGSNFMPSALVEKVTKDAVMMDISLDVANMIMGASCDYYSDWMGDIKMSGQVAFSKLVFNLKGETMAEEDYTKEINIIWVPQEVCTYMYESRDNPEDNFTVNTSTYTNGFFVDQLRTMVIGITEDQEAIKDTLVHESIHAFVSIFPEFKETMYGGSEAAQAEESVTHVVTNHFKQLMSLHSIQFNVEPILKNRSETSKSGESVVCTFKTPILTSAKLGQRELVTPSEYSEAELDKLIAARRSGMIHRDEWW